MWRSLLYIMYVAVRAVVCLFAISLTNIVLPGLGVGPAPVYMYMYFMGNVLPKSFKNVHVPVHVHVDWTASMTLFHKKKM